MIAGTLKVLTWGTVTAAVVSAALLTAGEGGISRTERGADTPTRSPARASAITATPGPSAGPAALRNAPEGSNERTESRS